MNELISEKDSVPKGWIKTTMDSVAVIILGQSPPSSTYNQEKKGLPFFQGKTDFGLMYPAVRNWCSDPKKSAEKNDILISVRAPVGPTNISKEKCCIGRGLAAIRPLSGVNYLWIFYHLRLLKNNIAMKGTGTTFKAISGTQLKSIILSIPPLNEQKRIISKIESIFAQIDAIKERLEMLAPQTKSTSGSLSVLKKSILKQAFEGKLVLQDPNDEPAEIFLRVIQTNSQITIANNDLPMGWIRTTLDNVAMIILGQSPPSSTYNQEKTGLPFFQGKTDFGLMHPTVRNWCSDPKKIAEKNDILISVRAPVGPTNISKEKCCIGRGLSAIRPLREVNHLWIFYHLRLLENNIATKGTGTTFKAITGSQLKSIVLNIPPMNEQKRIVAKIESIFGNIDSIEKQVNDAIRSLNTLKQSVLKLAFEGKLVPQDPNDEPALVLLEKIKLQKK